MRRRRHRQHRRNFRRINPNSAMRKREERMLAYIASMKDLIFVLSNDLVIQSFYQPEGEQLHLPPSQFVGYHIDDINFPEHALGPIRRALEETLRTGQSGRAEYYLDLPTGRTWFDLRSTVYFTRGDAPAGIVCVVRDIDSLKRAELDLQAKKEEVDRFFTVALDML
ncbi:MAG: PAS domain-containing protein, partial [Candidatus Sumerlaeia bacterium]|nr:PAS domain-containing protein [Candidatus Sumerlaeia bacterium]